MNLQICTTRGEDLLLRDVSTYVVDREVLRVLYCNGDRHNFLLENVRWFGEITETPECKKFVGYAPPDESILSILDHPLVEKQDNWEYQGPESHGTYRG